MNRLRSAPRPLLVDLGEVPAAHCDDCLDGLFKAMAIDPKGDGDRSIWRPHENPAISAHVEAATARFQQVLEALQDAFAKALTGEPIGTLAKAEVPWLRWSASQFDAARLHLEAIRPAQYGLDDWMMLVDFLIQRYLPDGAITDLAEYVTVRAAIMGKVQAHMDQAPLADSGLDLSTLAELVPTEFAKVPPRALSALEVSILRLAKQRTALHISDLAEGTRGKMKKLIIEHLQAMMLGQRDGSAEHLRTRLFDNFGTLNRDFRRIAVTETGEANSAGFIAAQPYGTRLRRVEAYYGACDFCKSINGRIYVVADPSRTDLDGQKEVWVGKTNAGRSASPRKRAGGELVDREPHELWWCAAGVQHPHCRGGWVYAGQEPAETVDPDFTSWMRDLIAQHSPAARRDRRLDAEIAAAEAEGKPPV